MSKSSKERVSNERELVRGDNVFVLMYNYNNINIG
jgi:hypothetical protein